MSLHHLAATGKVRIRIRSVYWGYVQRQSVTRLGELAHSPYKGSKRRNSIFRTLRSRDKGICQGAQISYSLGEKNCYKCQSQPMGFEMPGNDDSWYACLGEQCHLWIYWLHPLDLCKAL